MKFAHANLCKLHWAILISSIYSVQYLLKCIWTKWYQHHFCILPSSKAGAFKPSKGPFCMTAIKYRLYTKFRKYQSIVMLYMYICIWLKTQMWRVILCRDDVIFVSPTNKLTLCLTKRFSFIPCPGIVTVSKCQWVFFLFFVGDLSCRSVVVSVKDQCRWIIMSASCLSQSENLNVVFVYFKNVGKHHTVILKVCNGGISDLKFVLWKFYFPVKCW